MVKQVHTSEFTVRDIPVIFDVLTDEEKDFLQKNHTVIYYKKNQIIYHEGEEPAGLQCLASGKVKIFKEGVGGRDQIIRLAKAPGFIGYRALFAGENHIATAVVIEPCVIIYIKKNIISQLLQVNNRLCLNIIKSFATELGFSRYRTVSLTQKHVRGRIAESLLILRDTYGYMSDGHSLNVLFSREDLASLSNMTASNATRTLSNFVAEGTITVEGRSIKILDEKKLEWISKIG